MERQSVFWSRELAKKFIQYSSVGVVSIPFGLAYALLAIAGWDHWLVAVIALAGGFSAARFVWAMLEKRVLVRAVEPIQRATVTGAEAGAEFPSFWVVEEHWRPLVESALEVRELERARSVTRLANSSTYVVNRGPAELDEVATRFAEFQYFSFPSAPKGFTHSVIKMKPQIAGSTETVLAAA